MIRTLTLSAALFACLSGAALAMELTPGTKLGTDAGAITAALTERGYTLREYERDDGYIEVKAIKDGRRWELKIDPKTGEVSRVEADD